MQEVIGTREATKRETRRALIEAALTEFAAKGFDAPSLDAICARAGYTRGAFYVHFSNRDELVSAAMEHAIGIFVDDVLARDADAGSDDGDASVTSTVDRFVSFMGLDENAVGRAAIVSDAPPFHKFLEACSRSETVRGGMAQALERVVDRLGTTIESGQSSGLLREDVDARGMAGALLLLALGVFSMNEIGLKIDVPVTKDAVLRLYGRKG